VDVRPLLPQAVDSSLFSDHRAIAGALIGALVVARRSFGWTAAGLGVVLALGRIGAGVQYPSDCLVGAAVGVGCFLLLLPLRGPVSRAIDTERSWKTFGERVTAAIHPAGDHSVVEVTSALLLPQLIDYGKNRSNVNTVIEILASFQHGSTANSHNW
jgi:PAP2 superfamily